MVEGKWRKSYFCVNRGKLLELSIYFNTFANAIFQNLKIKSNERQQIDDARSRQHTHIDCCDGRKGQVGPPWWCYGRCRFCECTFLGVHGLRPRKSILGRARPFLPRSWPHVADALFGACHGREIYHRRLEEFPPVGVAVPGPPGARCETSLQRALATR